MRRAYCQLTLITRNNATDAGDVSGSAPGRKQTPAVGTQRVTKDDVRPDCSAYLFNSFSGISLFFYLFFFYLFILFYLFFFLGCVSISVGAVPWAGYQVADKAPQRPQAATDKSGSLQKVDRV